ncbi:MAG: class B sortase [Clostridia bacterium]|nr:class B sortase [Clostridia bacterium]
MKKSKHTKSKSKRIIIRTMLVIVFLISIAVLLLHLHNLNKEKQDNQNILENIKIDTAEVTEERTEKMIQLEELQKENEEIIGWLEIAETNINLPVCQAQDNSYYLTHNYKKEKATSGALFLDKDFNLDKPSTNYLIYGHRNKNGTMFEDLMKYKDEQFFKSHPTIKFTTTKEDTEYQIIAVFFSRVYYKDEQNVFRYYQFVNAESETEYNEYISNCKKASIYDTGATAEYGEQLLTLSTCEYSQEDGRFAIVAKKK